MALTMADTSDGSIGHIAREKIECQAGLITAHPHPQRTSIGFAAHAPIPPCDTRRGRRTCQYAHNERYDPLYTHARDVPDEIPWEDKITMLIVEYMREQSMRLQGELESSIISTGCQQSLQIFLHNLNNLIETYIGVGPSNHVFYDMIHRRRMTMMDRHKFEEIKNIVTK
jgi:hypothetical protein